MDAAASTPDAYVAGLTGWQAVVVRQLRAVATSLPRLDETIKWGHLVYACNGPALLIRADDESVQFGFWRGSRLREIEPGLKPGGKYEMAKFVITAPPGPDPATLEALCREAIRLNLELGNPQDAARK